MGTSEEIGFRLLQVMEEGFSWSGVELSYCNLPPPVLGLLPIATQNKNELLSPIPFPTPCLFLLEHPRISSKRGYRSISSSASPGISPILNECCWIVLDLSSGPHIYISSSWFQSSLPVCWDNLKSRICHLVVFGLLATACLLFSLLETLSLLSRL
jgi:hypothetical protein